MSAASATLKDALSVATRAHYQRYVATHPGESYYGYSLYTDDDVSSIGPAATRASGISVSPSDPMWVCYKFGPHEWRDFDDFGLFTEVNAILKELYRSLDFASYRTQSLQAAYDALRDLEAEGLFGPRSENRYVVLWLSDSSDPIMEKAAREFNCPTVYAAFAKEYGTAI